TAWPDPPDTQRSEPPPLDLHVHETWRTGDRMLDRSRGIVPAVIEGGLVSCAPEPRDEPAGGGLSASDRLAVAGVADLIRPHALDVGLARGPLLETGARVPTRFDERLSVERARLEAATAGSFGTHRFERLPEESLRVDEVV